MANIDLLNYPTGSWLGRLDMQHIQTFWSRYGIYYLCLSLDHAYEDIKQSYLSDPERWKKFDYCLNNIDYSHDGLISSTVIMIPKTISPGSIDIPREKLSLIFQIFSSCPHIIRTKCFCLSSPPNTAYTHLYRLSDPWSGVIKYSVRMHVSIANTDVHHAILYMGTTPIQDYTLMSLLLKDIV